MRRRPTSVLLLHAQLPLQGLPELPLSDQLHLQLRALQLVLLLLRPRVLYGNPQQTLLGGTQARIDRLDTGPEDRQTSDPAWNILTDLEFLREKSTIKINVVMSQSPVLLRCRADEFGETRKNAIHHIKPESHRDVNTQTLNAPFHCDSTATKKSKI